MCVLYDQLILTFLLSDGFFVAGKVINIRDPCADSYSWYVKSEWGFKDLIVVFVYASLLKKQSSLRSLIIYNLVKSPFSLVTLDSAHSDIALFLIKSNKIKEVKGFGCSLSILWFRICTCITRNVLVVKNYIKYKLFLVKQFVILKIDAIQVT